MLLDRRMVPGDPVLVGSRGVERLRDDVEKGAGVGERPVAVGDADGDPDQEVLAPSRDDDLGRSGGGRPLPDVERTIFAFEGGGKNQMSSCRRW